MPPPPSPLRLLLISLCLVTVGAVPVAAAQPDFVRDVQPILRDACWSCHCEKKQKGGLRLDDKHLAMKGGSNGLSIKAGDSAHS